MSEIDNIDGVPGLDYLSEEIIVSARCPKCNTLLDKVHGGSVDYECPSCFDELYATDAVLSFRPAEWWTVAIYLRGRDYGGPEEGGWYYDTGELTKHCKIRVFEAQAEAETYMFKTLPAYFDSLGIDDWRDHYSIAGTTEKMPEPGYPKRRPYYS